MSAVRSRALTCAAALAAVAVFPGRAAVGGADFTFDSAADPRGTGVYRAATAPCAAADGAFVFRASFKAERLDHWNSFRLLVAPPFGAGMRLEFAREQRAVTNACLTVRQFADGEKTDEVSVPCVARDLTLAVARRDGEFVCAWRDAAGAVHEVARVPARLPGAAAVSAKFDSPPNTVSRVVMTGTALAADTPLPDAFTPSYGDAADCPVTVFSDAARADAPVRLAPGDRLLFAARAPVTACGWTLSWRSEGRVRIRMLQLGSAETLQLSDNVVWDDIEDAVPDGLAERSRGLTPWILRFNTDVKTPLSYPATSGVFFFEAAPAGDAPVTFGAPRVRCRPLRAPAPLAPGAGVTDYPVRGRVGAVDVVHAAGRQAASDPDTLAGWLYVYADGTTAPAFATLRWNCGVSGEGMMEKSFGPDTTWFGPPGFAWGRALYTPANEHGTHWTARYAWRFVNPHPEKEVRCVQMFRLPGDARAYTVESVTPVAAAEFTLALVEPAVAVLTAGETADVNVYEYRAAPGGAREEAVAIGADKADVAGRAVLRRRGAFGAAAGRVTAGAAACPGGLTLRCGAARSSRLSLMPPPQDGEPPFRYTMICGGADHIMDFDRMRRAGYDEAKIQIAWVRAPDGGWDFGRWDWHVEKIARAGMDVSIRNTFRPLPDFTNRVEALRGWRDGAEVPVRLLWQNDTADPFVREQMVDYYAAVGRFAARHPNVKGINANYGQRTAAAICGRAPTLVWTEKRLARFRDWLRARGKRAEGITPDAILHDRALLADYARCNEEILDGLIDGICAAIRANAPDVHLAFNLSFHPVEGKLMGQTFGAYLKCGLKYAPASLFHETSERYSLSFVKWLAAARTCGLIYGDECCQNPPTYEQAAFAYMWMGMMQCFEANYCQWWGGRPATENVAQFKAYHRLLQSAAYQPDPVCLALSLDTGYAEAGDTLRVPLHTQTAQHYALAHFLRELNINADRYMIDALPEKDAAVRTRLLIDDNTRAMPDGFAARIERFVRDGGVFLASSLTDVLNGRAFLSRLGIDFDAARAAAAPDDPFPFCEQDVGAGKVVVLLKSWNFGWDPGRPEAERRKARALLTRLGAFEPLVETSHPCVFATPYRAPDGAGLVSVINITCRDRTVEVGLSPAFAGGGKPAVQDLASGRLLDVRARGGRWTATVPVPAIGTTVLRVANGAGICYHAAPSAGQ